MSMDNAAKIYTVPVVVDVQAAPISPSLALMTLTVSIKKISSSEEDTKEVTENGKKNEEKAESVADRS